MTPRAYIRGAGTSSFGRRPDVPLEELVCAGVTEALRDAGDPAIDAVFAGTAWGRTGVAHRMLLASGIAGVSVLRYENACASGATAFHEAVLAVESGRFDTVLVVGFEQMSAVVEAGIPARGDDVEGRLGRTAVALYALSADRYLQHGDLTREELASVAVKNLRHGAGNPRTLGRTPRTLDEVLGSPMVAEPLTRLQCGPISDGAGALVVSRRRSAAGDVAVRGTALHSGGPWSNGSPNPWGYDLVARTAAEAYAQAGVEVADIDCFELHDAFTIGEVITGEALGLAPVWSGDTVRDHKRHALGGSQPVNPSGGLIARGHPLGATGVVQLAEIVWQVRGTAAGHQVDGARLGVAETMGGGVSGLDGNGCVVSVLEGGR